MSYTAEHNCTIHISYTEHDYGPDAYDASGSLTIPAPQCPSGIKIEYKNHKCLDQVLDAMHHDLRAYLEDPEAWVKDYLAEGPDTWEKLRALEDRAKEQREKIKYFQEHTKLYEGYLYETEKSTQELKDKLVAEIFKSAEVKALPESE